LRIAPTLLLQRGSGARNQPRRAAFTDRMHTLGPSGPTHAGIEALQLFSHNLLKQMASERQIRHQPF